MRAGAALLNRPNVPEPNPVSTPVNWVWFQVLKVSRRSSRRLPRASLNTKLLNSDMFQFWRCGKRTASNLRLPHGADVAVNVGTLNAEGSIHWICCWQSVGFLQIDG